MPKFTVWVASATASVFTGIRFDGGAIMLRPLDFMVLTGLIYGLLHAPDKIFTAFNRLRSLLCLYMAVYMARACSGVLMGSPVKGMVEIVQAVEMVCLSLLIAMVTAERASRWLFIKSFFCVLLPIGLYAAGFSQIEQVNTGVSSGFKQLNEPKYTFGYMATLLISGFFSGYLPGTWTNRILLISIVGLVILSGERSAWLGTGVVVCFFVGTLNRQALGTLARRVLLPVSLVAVTAAAGFYFTSRNNNYIERQIYRFVEPLALIDLSSGEIDYLATESPSNRSRLIQLSNVIQILKDHPLTGVGTSNYREFALQYITPSNYNGLHGEFWFLLGENGVLAAGMYAFTWFAWFLTAKRMALLVPTGALAQVNMVRGMGIYGAVLALFIGGGVVNLLLLILPLGLMGGLRIEFCRRHKSDSGYLLVQGSRRRNKVTSLSREHDSHRV